MKSFFKQNYIITENTETIQVDVNLKESIQKTREALEVAYTGFDNAVDSELIDSYIYEITALQKRYNFLSEQLSLEPEEEKLHQHSPIRALVSHVFG